MTYIRYRYCVSGTYQGFQDSHGPYEEHAVYNDLDEAVSALKIMEHLGEHSNISLYEMKKIEIPEEIH